MSANKYPDWLREAASRGGKAKSAAKTAAARKANAARWRDHKPKRAARRHNAAGEPPPTGDSRKPKTL